MGVTLFLDLHLSRVVTMIEVMMRNIVLADEVGGTAVDIMTFYIRITVVYQVQRSSLVPIIRMTLLLVQSTNGSRLCLFSTLFTLYSINHLLSAILRLKRIDLIALFL